MSLKFASVPDTGTTAWMLIVALFLILLPGRKTLSHVRNSIR
jgi:hypothetical protein